MEQTKFHYNATVTKVVDGDTIHCDIDLGFGVILKNQTFRFYGLNTPETKGSTREAGLKSKSFVENLLLNKPVIIQSIKDKISGWSYVRLKRDVANSTKLGTGYLQPTAAGIGNYNLLPYEKGYQSSYEPTGIYPVNARWGYDVDSYDNVRLGYQVLT